MKVLLLLACLMLISKGYAEDSKEKVEFHPDRLAAPLMALTQELPVDMSDLNRQNHFYDANTNGIEFAHNLKTIQEREIPWIFPLMIIVVVLAIIIIRTMPQRFIITKVVVDAIPPNLKAMQALKILADSNLVSKENYKSYFFQVDNIIRIYIENTYHIKTTSSTTPEFSMQASAIDSKTKQQFISFFENVDRIKFTNYHPNAQECISALKTAQELIGKQNTI